MVRPSRRFAETVPVLVDDAALARAAVDGQPAAAAAIWDQFSPLVRAILRRILGPDSEVNDLVQDVFLRIFKEIGTLRDPQAFRSFVMRVATHAAISELRRRRVRHWLCLTLDGILPEMPVGAVASSPERLAMRSLYRLLDELNPESRAAFVLYHIEELELHEVAAIMKISLATVKRRLAHARERLHHKGKDDTNLRAYLQGADHEST